MHILPGRMRIRLRELKGNGDIAHYLEDNLNRINWISSAKANPLTGSCLLYYEQDVPEKKVLEVLNKTLSRYSAAKHNYPPAEKYKSITADVKLNQVVTGGAILTLFWRLSPVGPAMPVGLGVPLASAALITTGYPIIKSGLNFFSKHKRPNYDLLVTAYSFYTAIAGQGYLGLATMWLSTLRSYLQQLSFKIASSTFSNILIKKGNRVALLDKGQVRHVLPGDVNPGDLALFKKGDCAPVEGVVVSGQALVIPGEILKPGQLLEPGTILENGSVVVRVHRVAEDTSLARLADILDDAVEQPSIGNEYAITYAERLLPVTFFSTVMIFLITRDLGRSMSVLLAGAPGPAGLAAPTAYSAATTVAAGLGIAIKDSEALDSLSSIDAVVFHDDSIFKQVGNYNNALQDLESEGYLVENYDPHYLHDGEMGISSEEDDIQQAHKLIKKIHEKGIKVAWVSGPSKLLLVKEADVNIMFLTGKEKELPGANILIYKNDPKQIYRAIALSRKSMQTIRQNVFMVQGINLFSEALGVLGLLTSLPSLGVTVITTSLVVYNSARSLFRGSYARHLPHLEKGTLKGLSTGQKKCFWVPPVRKTSSDKSLTHPEGHKQAEA